MSTISTVSEKIEENISVQNEEMDGENQYRKEINGLPPFKSEEVILTEEESLSINSEETLTLQETIQENKEEVSDNLQVNSDGGDEIQENHVNNVIHTATVLAIEKFSTEEAEKIIKEAILIKHVLDEDKSQFIASSKSIVDKITGEKITNDGYDRYLIDKLLHSEPDPTEDAFEGFGGLSAPGGRDLPGLLTALENGTKENENHVLGAEDTANEDLKEKTSSSQSILHKEFDLTEAFGENALQTIDEDKELTLHDDLETGVKENGNKEEGKVILMEEENKTSETETHNEANDKEIVMAEEEVEVEAKDNFEAEVESSGDEEEDIGEMTYKQKKAVVAAVRQGNIDLLEDLLDKRHADINMLWYNENLIMVAIKSKQEQMAEFLIDNEVDVNHSTLLIEKTDKGNITTYPQTCRDMAYERNMEDLVELIDYKTNNLFSFVQPKKREIRIRRPRPPTPPTPEIESEDEFTTEDGSQKQEVTRGMEDHILTEAKLRKFERDLDSGLNGSNNAENERKISVIKSERVHSEAHTNSGNDSNHRESMAESSHVSHVFGMDEGYETMSPVSPVFAPLPPKLDHNVIGTREHVSIRGTRASHSAKMHNFKTISKMAHCESENTINQIGLHSRENRRWYQTKSAPTMRCRQSYESIPELVRTGVPFVHGDKKFVQSNRNKTCNHVISPYSQVAHLLAGSRILKPKSASSLPSIHNGRIHRQDSFPIRTETHYVYAERNSANLCDRVSFLHQPRVSTAGSSISRPKRAW